jgi:hypothetical protein
LPFTAGSESIALFHANRRDRAIIDHKIGVGSAVRLVFIADKTGRTPHRHTTLYQVLEREFPRG